jgi:hypothetical protein
MLNPAGSPSVTGGSGYFKPGSISSDVFTTQKGIVRMILKK